MQLLKLSFFLSINITLFACNTTGAKNAANTPKGFLNSDNIFPTKDAKKLSVEEMKMYLGGSDFAYNNAPESSEETEIQNESYNCNMRKIERVKIRASKTTVTLEGELDFMECEEDAELIKESRNKFFSILFCSSANFSSWNGKSALDFIKSIGSLDDSCKDGTGYTFSNTLYSFRKEASAGASNDYTLLSLSGVMTRNNDVCHFTVTKGVRKYQDGCFEFASSDYAPMGISNKIFVSGEYNKVESELGSIFKSSGELDIIINNWTGKLSFKIGKAPSYLLTNGESTAEGVISSNMALTTPSPLHSKGIEILNLKRPFLIQSPN
ncbi:MAG: hypothetical protein KBD78_02365 [Oligoflexales bacterium]|nr:hypothetical protein [Oligoflexales bacterium]